MEAKKYHINKKRLIVFVTMSSALNCHNAVLLFAGRVYPSSRYQRPVSAFWLSINAEMMGSRRKFLPKDRCKGNKQFDDILLAVG